MLRLTRGLMKAIEDHGVASYPLEGCGLLLGTLVDGVNDVSAIYPVPNSWGSEEEKRYRFRIADLDLMDAEDAAADLGLEVIGVFHSHPNHPPVASPRDLAWATWPGFSYLITEIHDRRPGASRSWQLRDERSAFFEEQIVVRNDAN